MSSKLDNDLKNRIRDVFDTYEDASADAGWQLLRERFPEKKKDRVIAWWWYSAAAVLLMCLGIWFIYPRTEHIQVVHNPKKVAPILKPHTNDAAQPPVQPIIPADGLAGNQVTIAQAQPRADVKSNASVNALNPKNEVSFSKAIPKYSNPDNLVSNILPEKFNSQLKAGTNPVNAADVQHGQNATEKAAVLTNKAEVFANNEAVKTSGITTDTAGNTNVGSAVKQTSVIAQHTADKPKQDAISKMFADDQAKQQILAKNDTKKKENAAAKRAVMMSVYAATYFNYAKGSTNQVNVGAGFTSDFKLSGNLRLSTGVAIAQNSLSFNNGIPQQLNDRVTASADAAQVSTSNYSPNAFVKSTISPPTVKNYSASLIGLDIPLNIKYQFNPQKSDTYILAGISSGTYIDENYSSSYTYNNAFSSVTGLIANSAETPVQQTSAHQHFSSFDFAKTLNFSFGMGYPMGRNRLIIEPFLKYPLGGLGSQDIRFGAGGINLKLNINAGKKK